MNKKDARTLSVLAGLLLVLIPFLSIYLGADFWIRLMIFVAVVIVAAIFLTVNFLAASSDANTSHGQSNNSNLRGLYRHVQVLAAILVVWFIAESVCFAFVRFCSPARIEGPYFAKFDAFNYPQEADSPWREKLGTGTYHLPIQQFTDIMGKQEFSRLKWFGTVGQAPINGFDNIVFPFFQNNQLFFRVYKAFFVRYLVIEGIEVELVSHFMTAPPDDTDFERVSPAASERTDREVKDIVEISYILLLDDLFPPTFGSPFNIKDVLVCQPHHYSRDGLFYKPYTPTGGIVLSNSPFASVSVMFESLGELPRGAGEFFLINVYVLVSNGGQPKRILVTKEPFWIGFETP